MKAWSIVESCATGRVVLSTYRPAPIGFKAADGSVGPPVRRRARTTPTPNTITTAKTSTAHLDRSLGATLPRDTAPTLSSLAAAELHAVRQRCHVRSALLGDSLRRPPA